MEEVSKGHFSSVHVDADQQVQVVTVIHDKSISISSPNTKNSNIISNSSSKKLLVPGDSNGNTTTVTISTKTRLPPNLQHEQETETETEETDNSLPSSGSGSGASGLSAGDAKGKFSNSFNYYVNLNSSRNWNQPNTSEIMQRLKKSFKFLFQREFQEFEQNRLRTSSEITAEEDEIPPSVTPPISSSSVNQSISPSKMGISNKFQSNFLNKHLQGEKGQGGDKQNGINGIDIISYAGVGAGTKTAEQEIEKDSTSTEEILTPILALDILQSFDLSLFHMMSHEPSATAADFKWEVQIQNVLDDLTEFITTSTNSAAENNNMDDKESPQSSSDGDTTHYEAEYYEGDNENVGLLGMTKFKLFKTKSQSPPPPHSKSIKILKDNRKQENDLYNDDHDLDLTPLAITVLLETGNLDETPAKTIAKYLVEDAMAKFKNFEMSVLKTGAKNEGEDDFSHLDVNDFDPVEYCNLIRLASQLDLELLDFGDECSSDPDQELDFFEEIQDFLYDFLENKLYLEDDEDEDENPGGGESGHENSGDISKMSFSPDAFLYFLSRAVSTNNSGVINEKLIDLLTDRILARLGYGTCLGFDFSLSSKHATQVQKLSPIDLSMRILALHHLRVLEKKSVKSCILAGELKSLMKLQCDDGSWPEDGICRLKGGGVFGGVGISTLFAMQALYVIQQGTNNGGY